ncbi:hypothetical protein AO703_09010 [[Enterobacter] lignolyticus]|uniref:Uncharacterized protein n=2 Tax=[Enterobacter] lignolyticus TaxID=1334193 RepID=A0A806XC95_9ENTR|nr:hypothetical protein AO703_09010 [[Enterobacter] lignolyticus]
MRDAQFLYIHTDSFFREFNPSPGDVIVLNITNANVFSHIMSHFALVYCRLIIMLPPQLTEKSGGKCLFPVFITDSINIHGLISYMIKAASAPVAFKKASVKEINLFKYVGHGYSVAELSCLMNIHEKSVYQIRRERLMKYGFRTQHPLAFLMSRDILNVSRVST